jgi:hypothetical protein
MAMGCLTATGRPHPALIIAKKATATMRGEKRIFTTEDTEDTEIGGGRVSDLGANPLLMKGRFT